MASNLDGKRIDFNRIFHGMPNGPEKIQENFDRVNFNNDYGDGQKVLPGPGMDTGAAMGYRLKKDKSGICMLFWIPNLKTGHPNSTCYLPTSITKRMILTRFIGETDNHGFGVMAIEPGSGKCTFWSQDDGGTRFNVFCPLTIEDIH